MFKELSIYSKYLKQLSPVELQFIYNHRESSSLLLLRITIKDLIIRQLIDLNITGNKHDVSEESYIVSSTIKNAEAELKPHERKVIELINRFNGNIQLRKLVRFILPTATEKRLFYFDNIYLPLVRQDFMKRTFLLEKMDFFRRTSKGKRLSGFIGKFIPYCFKNLEDWIETKPDLISELVNKLDTHVLLLDYLYWNVVDFYISLPEKERNSHLYKLSRNNFAKYIVRYCSDRNDVIDFRDINWKQAGLVSGSYTDNVNDWAYAAISSTDYR